MLSEDMRNLGIILLVVGLLLLILPKWFIVLVGVVGIVFGILMVLLPEKMIVFFSKFKSKKGE
ncbi:MAG: hypothetical protein H0Z29_11110 [Candidatus Marinimicrobia bacterium]|nr:hypothetical protein [Candidatus Neomarinimicrobiota bacterium]